MKHFQVMYEVNDWIIGRYLGYLLNAGYFPKSHLEVGIHQHRTRTKIPMGHKSKDRVNLRSFYVAAFFWCLTHLHAHFGGTNFRASLPLNKLYTNFFEITVFAIAIKYV